MVMYCKIPPVRGVEMWFMGRDSSMLLDMGTCRGILEDSGGGSTGGWCSTGLGDSSLLLGWLWDRDWAGAWGSEAGGATGGATGGDSSGNLAMSKTRKLRLKIKVKLSGSPLTGINIEE